MQFLEPDLPDQVGGILDIAGLAPERLVLEVTEGVLIGDSKRARSMMDKLRGQGIRLALDDFGTGHASLSYLRQFPFTTLKIDKSYVQSVGEDEQDLTVLKSIMMLAEGLKLDVVAEGVETEAQLAVLRQLRCPRVQGFLLGRPMPIEHVTEMLSVSE